jgi:hypothetical protein
LGRARRWLKFFDIGKVTPLLPSYEQEESAEVRNWRWPFAAFASAIFCLLAFATNVYPAQTSLAWDPNQPSEVAGYRLHYGDSSRSYSADVDVGNQTTCTVADLAIGLTYFFAVTAYDQYGRESDFSNEVSQTIYEDGEDFTLSGWDFCSQDVGGGNINNVFDEDRQSNVIELKGSGLRNCYRLRRPDFTGWNNSSQFVIQWSMKYSEFFRVALVTRTTAGLCYLGYSPVEENAFGEESYLDFGLGSSASDGQWHTFTRDLQADINMALPGTTILEVKRFLIRGSGSVDDIRMRQSP